MGGHPIWCIMRDEGRSLRWLSKKVDYHEVHLYDVRAGRRRASSLLRQRCATALNRPESELFIPEPERQEVRV